MFTRLVGSRRAAVFQVDEPSSVSLAAGNDQSRVLATPAMILWMEQTAKEAIRELLPEGYDTVGTLINVRHAVAVPLGQQVTVQTAVIEVRERRVYFRIECHGALGLVGEGTHERHIIHLERYLERVERRYAPGETAQ